MKLNLKHEFGRAGQDAAIFGMSKARKGFDPTQFAFCSSSESLHAAGRGLMSSRVLDLCSLALRGTISHLSSLRVQTRMYYIAHVRSHWGPRRRGRRPGSVTAVTTRVVSPEVAWDQSMEYLLYYDVSYAMSRLTLSRTLRCSTSPPPSLLTGRQSSQKAKVPTRNSRLVWKFGEIRAQEPWLRPILNFGIKGQRQYIAVKKQVFDRLAPSATIKYSLMMSNRSAQSPVSSLDWCRERSTLFHLPEGFLLIVKNIDFIKWNAAL